MNSKRLNLLFISHESSLSGAPILLLSLLKLLKKETSYNLFVCIKRGGELDSAFASVTQTIVLKPQTYQRSKFFVRKIIDYLFYRVRLLKFLKVSRQTDIVISNTITNGRLLKSVFTEKTPVIIYVHELESVIKILNKFNDVDLSLARANAFFSPTAAVTQNLVKHHQVHKKIFPLNYYIEPGIELSEKLLLSEQEAFFAKYKIPQGKFYVVGIGTANYRKGIDMFIEASRVVKDIDTDIYFVWIGDFIEEDVKEKMNSEIQNHDLKNITITGFIPHSSHTLAPFDILALTSREDPYPLVVLEAARLRIPAISFLGTGGIDDFIDNDAGFLLEERTAEALSHKIIFLKNNKDILTQRGNNAKQKVIELHSNPSLILQQFISAIESFNQNE